MESDGQGGYEPGGVGIVSFGSQPPWIIRVDLIRFAVEMDLFGWDEVIEEVLKLTLRIVDVPAGVDLEDSILNREFGE